MAAAAILIKDKREGEGEKESEHGPSMGSSLCEREREAPGAIKPNTESKNEKLEMAIFLQQQKEYQYLSSQQFPITAVKVVVVAVDFLVAENRQPATSKSPAEN